MFLLLHVSICVVVVVLVRFIKMIVAPNFGKKQMRGLSSVCKHKKGPRSRIVMKLTPIESSRQGLSIRIGFVVGSFM